MDSATNQTIPQSSCEPTIAPDEVNSIPVVLLQTVLGANIARLRSYCSQNYVLDPRNDQRTAKIYSFIHLIQAKMSKS